MTLGQRLSHLRTGAGLSQDALAEQLGVSRQSVSKWETDGSVPELDKLVRLSQVFGVTLDELVKGTADAPSGSEATNRTETPQGAKNTPPDTTGTQDTFYMSQTPPMPQDTAELLRLHRQKLTGIVLMAVALLATALNLALVFLMVPLFIAGVLCLVVRRRLGLAIGWTLWICALFVTRYASAISMSRLLSPGYWQHTSLATPLLALVQLAVLAVLAWRTLRNPPGLGACWGIWAGLLAALWLTWRIVSALVRVLVVRGGGITPAQKLLVLLPAALIVQGMLEHYLFVDSYSILNFLFFLFSGYVVRLGRQVSWQQAFPTLARRQKA